MDVDERANRARARMMYHAALARGELTDHRSKRKMAEMRQLSERESRQIRQCRGPMTVVELHVQQKLLESSRKVRDIYQIPFNSAKHPRADAGQPNGGQFIKIGTSLAGTSADQRDVEFAREFETPESPEVAAEANVAVPDFEPPVSHDWKYFPPKEVLAEQIRFPNPQHYESSEGKHFLVAFEPKWRYAPYAGLHVPGLDSTRVDQFLDLLERGSALRESLREKWDEYSEVDEQIKNHRWWLPSFPTEELRDLWNLRKRLLYEYEQLKGLWHPLKAEYRREGFDQHEVTGYRYGFNDDLRQGRGLYNAVKAYDETQRNPLNGGIGVEPTYDEMAMVSAPGDIMFAVKWGAAAFRGGYNVAKLGAKWRLERDLRARAKSLFTDGLDDFGRFNGALHLRRPRRPLIERPSETFKKMAVEEALEEGALRIYSPRSALIQGVNEIQHHVFLHRLKNEFKTKYGLDVDDYVVRIDDNTHQALHTGASKSVLKNKGGWWEDHLMKEIRLHEAMMSPGEKLTVEQLEAIGRRSLKRFNLDHLSFERYTRAGRKRDK